MTQPIPHGAQRVWHMRWRSLKARGGMPAEVRCSGSGCKSETLRHLHYSRCRSFASLITPGSWLVIHPTVVERCLLLWPASRICQPRPPATTSWVGKKRMSLGVLAASTPATRCESTLCTMSPDSVTTPASLSIRNRFVRSFCSVESASSVSSSCQSDLARTNASKSSGTSVGVISRNCSRRISSANSPMSL